MKHIVCHSGAMISDQAIEISGNLSKIQEPRGGSWEVSLRGSEIIGLNCDEKEIISKVERKYWTERRRREKKAKGKGTEQK